ncbi:MAG: sugar phosphate isomerase/epimerase family protein [Bilifractor sp.]
MKLSFSTEVVDLDHQAPNRNKRESKYFWDEMYQLISAGGFRKIDIPYEPKWDFGGRSGIPRTRRSIDIKFGNTEGYLKFLSENGIEGISSVHLDPTLFCQGALPIFFGAAEHFGRDAIQFASEAGADSFILTATPTCYAVRRTLGEASEEDFLKQMKELTERLADFAEEKGVRLCLKNEYWGLLRGDGITNFVRDMKENVYLDVDTAHLSIAGADVRKFIRENKRRIGSVTLTDTSFKDQKEAYRQVMPEFPAKAATWVFRDPGFGTVDLKACVEAAGEAGYDGTFHLNCRNSAAICRSILRARYYADHVLHA